MGSNLILAAIHRRGRRGVAAGDPADASGIAPAPARRLPDDLNPGPRPRGRASFQPAEPNKTAESDDNPESDDAASPDDTAESGETAESNELDKSA